MKIQYKLGYLIIIFIFLISFPLQAADKNEDVITYRKRMMKGVGANMGSLGDILKGKVSYQALMVNYAKAMHESAKTVATIFKQDTRGSAKKTRSKDEIWEKWDEFEKVSQDFVDASAGMVAAAESGDMANMGAAMKKLGRSCSGCHKPFRAKKK